ncbi:uncharacterized protein [Apostichopus japonicus]|uniref:uncharacterized protein n=1 Tax=Stichopus japonicus TaxID=307972 RepID=UPI003AB878F0
MLGYFDPNAKTKVITDASPVGLGGILVQIQAGQPHIIAYASRSLSDVEKRYSQTEKEALGIVWACERFHIYLYGISFELLTDHKPLQYIYAKKAKPSARIERWVLRLQSYDFQVVYIPGPGNITDCLSRLWPQANGEVERQNRTILKVLKIAQIQKSDWNLLNNFLLAYRSTPHSTTGVSPAESLFKRSLRTTLPDVKFSQSQEENMKDRDTEMKQKAKDYADVKRHAKTSDIQIGDHVLVKQKEQNKLTAPFCEVVDRINSQVTVESPEGVQYKRISAHLKKYQTDETHSDRSATPLQTESSLHLPDQLVSEKFPKDLKTLLPS